MGLQKHTKWLLAVLVAAFCFIGTATKAQVVLRKPAQPVRVLKKPLPPNADATWKPGTWRWNSKKKTYEWRPAHWVMRTGKKREWKRGKWIETKRGYKWKSGKWVK